jgi:SAM-dependent methyltransferase
MSSTEAERQHDSVMANCKDIKSGIYGVKQFGGDPRALRSSHGQCKVRRLLLRYLYSEKYDDWMEIGYGGGRWTRDLADALYLEKIQTLALVDRTTEAKEFVKPYLSTYDAIDWLGCEDGRLPRDLYVDAVFAMGVFPHFHAELFAAYLNSLSNSVQPGGVFLFSYGKAHPDFPTWTEGPKEAWYYYEDCVINELLASFGFTIEESIDLKGGWGAKFLACKRTS